MTDCEWEAINIRGGRSDEARTVGASGATQKESRYLFNGIEIAARKDTRCTR